MKTFVFGETEVKKTGRTASKPLTGGKQLVYEEITPVNSYDGEWKKFVNPTMLMTIAPFFPVVENE